MTLLFLVKLTYNVSKQFMIQKTSFEMIYKYNLRFNLLMMNKIFKYTAKQKNSVKTKILTD